MKPEPLKDKYYDTFTVEKDNKRIDVSIQGQGHWFDSEDILSAVNWLKEKIKIFDMKDKQEAYENNMHQLIDKAFKDVIKK